MVDEGDVAPDFELPGVREGEFVRVVLDESLGEDVIILAFYPGDFNPACDSATTGLDDLDLFTMQKDVTVLAVSGDSVFSHRAFADEYDLHIPLLADVRGTVASEYGVDADNDRYQTERAVFVIDHAGEIEYAWVADDIDETPNADRIRSTLEGIGDDETAQARYRVGHAHYIEGRRAFTSAMGAFEEREWMLASRDFTQAADEFDEAKDEFNTAVRFSDDEKATRYFERAERKSEALWRAADWLSDSAGAFASGEGARGEDLRQDTEGPLETAKGIHEPPDPDDFPPETDPAEETDEKSILPTAERDVDTTLELDEETSIEGVDEEVAVEGVDKEGGIEGVDEEMAAGTMDEEGKEQALGASGTEWETDELEQKTPVQASESVSSSGESSGETPASDSPSSEETEEQESSIDDAELEAITAELEEQNDATEAEREEVADSSDSDAANDERDEHDLELDLTDPTDGTDDELEEDEREDGDESPTDDFGSSNHGVPDSL